jgi:signal transduction histidine kinase
VTIDYGDEEIGIEVTDDGVGGPIGAGGHGLVGMRERAHLYGGHVDATPLPGGGFRVLARLPLVRPGNLAARS